MNKAGDLLECVSDKYSEGRLFSGGVYQVERSWDCGGSEFLDLVGVPGPWAPERFKPYVNAYTTTMPEYGAPHYPVIAPTAGEGISLPAPPDSETARTIVCGKGLRAGGDAGPTVVPADETARRKAMPVCSGVLDYFGAALLEVSKLSKFGGDKWNPGEPLHWARGKSADHADALVRHLMERGTIDPDSGLSHTVGVAWRALAMLQIELEAAGAPMARGAKVAK